MSCPPQFTIARGQRFQVIVEWKNTGTETYTFDVLLLIRAPGEADYGLIGGALDRTLPPGASEATLVFDGMFRADAPTGNWDAKALICDYDPNTGKAYVYAMLECLASIRVV